MAPFSPAGAQGKQAAPSPTSVPPNTLSLGTAAKSVPSSTADPVAAGAYLADAAHCAACHTTRPDRPFAGDLEIGSKFGVMYSSNITPDPKYGIGKWSEAEFVAALRDGKGRHGEYLYPSMPYPNFTKISDADVHALWMYFRTVKPVAAPVRKNRMKFPFNVRQGIGAWQAVFLKKGRYVADASQSPQWNRGAYLVVGLGHCGACHTPKNFAMADKASRPLQGAEIDHWFAPNIGGGRYSGLRDWNTTQIVDYLRTGHNDKNVAAVGPMMQTIARGTANLADSDLQAMAVYLKNQPAVADPKQPGTDFSWNADRRTAGGFVYAAHCQSCHGADGKGVDGVAPSLAGNSSVTSRGPDTVVRSVLQGYAPQGRWGAMPSFNQTLDAQEVADVVNYVRTAWGGGGVANAGTSMVNKMRLDGVKTEAGVNAALVCPPVETDQVDAATVKDIAALAKAAVIERGVAARLYATYRKRHPNVEGAQAANVLAGVFCRDVMAPTSGDFAPRQQRYIEFQTRLYEASARSR